MDNDAAMMGAALDVIMQDTKLRKALKRRDRKALLGQTQALYGHLNARHRITHFYFTSPERNILLRVHLPNRYGDRTDRITTLMAGKSGNPAYGIELGPMGTFTLRVVSPWYESGQLLGYVEMGEEIEHIAQKLSAILDVDLFTLIDKSRLERSTWEAGMKMLGRTSDWNQYPAAVMVHHTPAAVPKGLTAIGQRMEEDIPGGERRDRISGAALPGGIPAPERRRWPPGSGQIVVMQNITGLTRSLHKTILAVSGISLTIGGALFPALLFLSGAGGTTGWPR